MKVRVLSLVLTAVLLAMLCACSPEMPVISTEPISGEAPVGKPTPPPPGTRLTLGDLMGEMGETMVWSVMQNYEHTQQDTVTAVFPVSGKGGECTLTVTFDEAADRITAATLSYGDVSISVLTDDTMVLRDIMRAMDEG